MSNISNFNLSAFLEHINKAKTEIASERIVRFMIGNIAEDCPIELAVMLAQCIYTFRAKELLKEAEQN